MSRIVKDPEERKEELLQIGIHFFLQGGAKNVSIQNVVKEANVATGLFYYYFKTNGLAGTSTKPMQPGCLPKI